MFLNYFALFLIIFVILVVVYGIVYIHDIPYKIAEKREHPHKDAIYAAGWVSLFTLHAIWPFLWIWATMYQKDRGYGFGTLKRKEEELEAKVDELTAQIAAMQQRLQAFDDAKQGGN
ncbi:MULTISPECIES: DUF3302 domain-containing protein [Pseudovibrio]|uniref:DUF3302 domain-containing protein n=1 Tax=Stappiaceae TaxID=2821832 RepID=UPI002366A237|nr:MULTISPECIES: DUF3302 domain-containing protein [Pseudovibrio]MDD7909554.1 DUF3302 domain-containing protein [Pseudovibrio exalbescens]MDX5595093.1 DUF3302 domain-containing protein [Pseudovibrio sp. SPO723]